MTELTFEEVSCLLDDLDTRLLLGQLTLAEYRDITRSLGWSEERILDEISRRWNCESQS